MVKNLFANIYYFIIGATSAVLITATITTVSVLAFLAVVGIVADPIYRLLGWY